LIELCKSFLECIFVNPWEPRLIAECERILKELEMDPLPYDIFSNKKTNGLIDSWVDESCFGKYKPWKKKRNKKNKKT
jgi:hypothetical protein